MAVQEKSEDNYLSVLKDTNSSFGEIYRTSVHFAPRCYGM